MFCIAPSIFPAHFARLGEHVRGVSESCADAFVAGSAIVSRPDHRAVIDARRAEPTGAAVQHAA